MEKTAESLYYAHFKHAEFLIQDFYIAAYSEILCDARQGRGAGLRYLSPVNPIGTGLQH